MSDLHLVQAPVNIAALHQWGERRGLSRRGFLDEGAALHHLLGECFGPAALQPFRLMPGRGRGAASVFAYATDPSEALLQRAGAVATPDLLPVLDLSGLRSMPRPASAWQSGQRLGFDLRLRPVVRLAKALEHEGGRFAKGAEVDAWLSHRLNGGTLDREALYLDWLQARLGEAATLDRQTTRLERFQRSKVARGGRLSEGPDAVVFGTLQVGDPALFAEKLASGVGRHKSYGYGMILLRPPQRPC
ncbi:type I-E CRISPR-associated protein Cas6/Cse3/CasE [Shimia sp. SDUM112013]|uniref:type I-E CRISPR-associated protein Cas6/Cse3/CasE n=1 Tax=Shimia sp. SDUM112013 TaxID=3136160 RepID=UPI0032ED886B